MDKLGNKNEALGLVKEIETELSVSPWPFGKKKKKIKGISYPLYRLRIETANDSYRIFYLVEKSKVIVLRVVKKKDAEKAIKSLR